MWHYRSCRRHDGWTEQTASLTVAGTVCGYGAALQGVIRYLRPRAAESPCICYRRKTKVAYMIGAVMKYHP